VISTQKKLLYGLALVVSSALFANELVKATRSEEAPLGAERPAETDGTWTAVPAASAPGDATFDADASGVSSGLSSGLSSGHALEETPGAPRGAADAQDVLASLERALARLEVRPQAVGSRRSEDPQPVERTDAASGALPSESTLNAPVREERRASAADRARLQSFLDGAPLMGVICSESESVALFGGRGVHVGELLLGDDGRVTACSPLGVNVSVGGSDVWVALPAVRTRSAAPTSSSTLSRPSNEAPAAPVPAPDAGAPAQ
jgi:hypothetical protein